MAYRLVGAKFGMLLTGPLETSLSGILMETLSILSRSQCVDIPELVHNILTSSLDRNRN